MQAAAGMINHNSGRAMGNWIAVSRDMRDHPVVGMGQPVAPADTMRGSYSRYEAWQDLLMEAAYKPFEVLNRGKTVTLKRGQLLAARSWLATRWNWSEKTVRVFIGRLEEEFMVRADTAGRAQTGRFSNVLSICNYDIYQTAYELMRLSEEACESGPDERPDERPDKGPDECGEKAFNNNVVSLSKILLGPDEGPDKGPDKGPQYNNTKQSREREDACAHDGATRMPDDWYLPNEWGQWAMHACKRDREWVIEASKRFKDYWRSVPDSKGYKKSWRATWQNWCRNTLQREAKYADAKKPSRQGWGRPRTAQDMSAAEFQAYLERGGA